MSATPREHLQRQVGLVQRRLFLGRLGRRLLECGVVCLLLYTGFLLSAGVRSQGWSLTGDVFLLRLVGLVGIAFLAGLTAFVVAWPRRPSSTDAALSLDDACRLQQRVTTCLGLSAADEASPAGQAVLADTQRRTQKLKLAELYPLRPGRRAALLAPALLLVVGAMLFGDVRPSPAPPRDADAQPLTAQTKAELEDAAKRLRDLAGPPPEAKSERPRTRDFEKIAAEIERLAGQQPKNQGEARELMKDMTTLEDRMRRLDKSLAERADALAKQAELADRLARKRPDEKTTPTQDALKDGDFKRAADELKRLTRELEQQGDKSPQERDQLDREIADLKERLSKIAEELNKGRDAQERLDAEQLEALNELEKLDRADLKAALEALEKAAQAMKDGKSDEAMKKLAEAAEKMGRLDPKGDQEGLARQLAMLQAMKERLGQSMPGNNPTPASGKRPEAPPKEIQGKETQAKSDRSPGALSGFRLTPGTGLREPKSAEEMRGLIDQAGREAAEAAQRQRLPRNDAEMTRGFYERLRREPKK